MSMPTYAHTGWGKRNDVDGRQHVHLLDEQERSIGNFPRGLSHDAVDVAGQRWTFDAQRNALTAEVDGARFEAKAAQQFSRTKEIAIDLNGRPAKAVNERRGDWVVVDTSDAKLAQFSGGNNGVRHSYTEFEPGATSHDEQVFLSVLTRTVLESKLSSTSVALIGTLVLLSIFLVLVFL